MLLNSKYADMLLVDPILKELDEILEAFKRNEGILYECLEDCNPDNLNKRSICISKDTFLRFAGKEYCKDRRYSIREEIYETHGQEFGDCITAIPTNLIRKCEERLERVTTETFPGKLLVTSDWMMRVQLNFLY